MGRIRRRAAGFACCWLVAAAAAAQPGFAKPALITSAGQSADAAIVKLAANTQYGVGLEYNPSALPRDLDGVRSVVLVVGTTPEGLASAGTDLPGEIERTKALLAAARANGLSILAVHTGGRARRDKASNQLIELVVPQADYVVVVAAGNADKLFQKLAAARNTPVVQVDRVPAVGGALSAVFNRSQG
ncbi:MAG TPA: DUF6305 family protein [Vicinamibacterales bacterium]|nr:DUF6305 family protein [Vicinamibacterales bacterium]